MREGQTFISLKQREDRVSVPEHETRITQTRISASKRETRGFPPPKCESRVLPTPKRETRILPVLERDSRVSNTKRYGRVLRQTQPTLEVSVSTSNEVYVSKKKCEARVQTGMSLRQPKPSSPWV